MTEQGSLVNIPDLGKPITVFIEKIASAIGMIWEPRQILRLAQAQSEAEEIRRRGELEVLDIETQIKQKRIEAEAHLTEVEILKINAEAKVDYVKQNASFALSELQQRAIKRFIAEETKKQMNIESIGLRALLLITQSAKPEDMDNDWISMFFDKSRHISDDQMQFLWAKILAGEANAPGAFSRRTISILASFEKSDAVYFTSFCRYCCRVGSDIHPFLPHSNELGKGVYSSINAEVPSHLNTIGLINYSPPLQYYLMLDLTRQLYYYDHLICDVPLQGEKDIYHGFCCFTRSGKELYSVVDAPEVPGFAEHVKKAFLELRGRRK